MRLDSGKGSAGAALQSLYDARSAARDVCGAISSRYDAHARARTATAHPIHSTHPWQRRQERKECPAGRKCLQ